VRATKSGSLARPGRGQPGEAVTVRGVRLETFCARPCGSSGCRGDRGEAWDSLAQQLGEDSLKRRTAELQAGGAGGKRRWHLTEERASARSPLPIMRLATDPRPRSTGFMRCGKAHTIADDQDAPTTTAATIRRQERVVTEFPLVVPVKRIIRGHSYQHTPSREPDRPPENRHIHHHGPAAESPAPLPPRTTTPELVRPVRGPVTLPHRTISGPPI